MSTTPDDPAARERLHGDILGFAESHGRRPRLLIAAHGDAARAAAAAYAGLGFDVDLGPLSRTPAECARQAVENDVHAVGAGGDAALASAIAAELHAQGADDVVVFDIAAPASGDTGAAAIASAQAVLVRIRDAASA